MGNEQQQTAPEQKQKGKVSFKGVCIKALFAALILVVITLALGYLGYQNFIKPQVEMYAEKYGVNLDMLGDVNKNITDLKGYYEELKKKYEAYDALKKQYLNEENYQKLDELNREYDAIKEKMALLEKLFSADSK